MQMSDDLGVMVSHVGICVSDFDRSCRFYSEALGFTVDRVVDINPPFHTLTEMPAIKARGGFMLHGNVKVELLHYDEPEAVGPAQRRPINQLGLTHLAFVVTDLSATAMRIKSLGGTVLPGTKVTSPMGDMMFATDPDGTRLELWEKIDPV